jgi:hypothetical protein
MTACTSEGQNLGNGYTTSTTSEEKFGKLAFRIVMGFGDGPEAEWRECGDSDGVEPDASAERAELAVWCLRSVGSNYR